MEIAVNLARVRAALPPGVTLVAVSKTQPPAAIREAHAAGQRDFGENYAQEWRAKADALADLAGLRWHFVGGLQTNKVKYLAGRVAFVHTVDRLELAAEISRRWAKAGAVARVLIEVDLGGEERKAGCAPAEVEPLCAAVAALPAVEVVGLTCIPPPADDPRAALPRPQGPARSARAAGAVDGDERRLADRRGGGGHLRPDRDGDLRRAAGRYASRSLSRPSSVTVTLNSIPQ